MEYLQDNPEGYKYSQFCALYRQWRQQRGSGPGSVYARGGSFYEDVRARRVPLVGDGGGVVSFIHVADAAEATVLALGAGPTGEFNVVDDEPALVREWLPRYAAAARARRPLWIPRALARLGAGPYGVYPLCDQRGARNARFRAAYGWSPAHPSWRQGFGAELGATG